MSFAYDHILIVYEVLGHSWMDSCVVDRMNESQILMMVSLQFSEGRFFKGSNFLFFSSLHDCSLKYFSALNTSTQVLLFFTCDFFYRHIIFFIFF